MLPSSDEAPPPPAPCGRPAVIPSDVVRRVRRLAGLGWSYVAIAREVGMSAVHARRIARGDARKRDLP